MSQSSVVVVADTSPINYLVLIGQVDLLRQMYTRILIPPAVLTELKHPLAPKPVQNWATNASAWVEVLTPKNSLILAQLDLGESQAIELATEVHADVLLIDKQAGRQEAVRRGLKGMPSEGHILQFRFESFNFTNTPTFGQPASGLRGPATGTITEADEPRRIQFALKYTF